MQSTFKKFNLRSNSRATTKFFTHLVVVAMCCFLPATGQDNWNYYSSPGGDFKVQMPGEVTEKLEDRSGRKMHMYSAQSGDVYCNLISSGIENSDAYFDRFKEGVIKGAAPDEQEDKPEYDEQKVSGQGWQGYLVTFKKPGAVKGLLIAKADGKGVTYTMGSTLPYNSQEGKKYFDSLEVDPEAAGKVHKGENTSPIYMLLFTIGLLVGFVFLIVIAGGVILFIVKRSKNPG